MNIMKHIGVSSVAMLFIVMTQDNTLGGIFLHSCTVSVLHTLYPLYIGSFVGR